MNLQRLLSSDTSSPLSKVIPIHHQLHHHPHQHQRAPSLSSVVSVVSVDQVSPNSAQRHASRVALNANPHLVFVLVPPVVRSSPARARRPPCHRIPQKAPRRRQVAHLLLPLVRAPQHQPRPNRKPSLWRQWQWQWQRQRQVKEKGGRLRRHRPISVAVCHRVPCQGMSIDNSVSRPSFLIPSIRLLRWKWSRKSSGCMSRKSNESVIPLLGVQLVYPDTPITLKKHSSTAGKPPQADRFTSLVQPCLPSAAGPTLNSPTGHVAQRQSQSLRATTIASAISPVSSISASTTATSPPTHSLPRPRDQATHHPQHRPHLHRRLALPHPAPQSHLSPPSTPRIPSGNSRSLNFSLERASTALLQTSRSEQAPASSSVAVNPVSMRLEAISTVNLRRAASWTFLLAVAPVRTSAEPLPSPSCHRGTRAGVKNSIRGPSGVPPLRHCPPLHSQFLPGPLGPPMLADLDHRPQRITLAAQWGLDWSIGRQQPV